mmetsp:Transcript_1506/g.3323  ORF Transcript_1506/g.3323 Transcript_1506/m.3323 type:complete len:265 (-) Transcript_1506:2950-3744(-)
MDEPKCAKFCPGSLRALHHDRISSQFLLPRRCGQDRQSALQTGGSGLSQVALHCQARSGIRCRATQIESRKWRWRRWKTRSKMCRPQNQAGRHQLHLFRGSFGRGGFRRDFTAPGPERIRCDLRLRARKIAPCERSRVPNRQQPGARQARAPPQERNRAARRGLGPSHRKRDRGIQIRHHPAPGPNDGDLCEASGHGTTGSGTAQHPRPSGDLGASAQHRSALCQLGGSGVAAGAEPDPLHGRAPTYSQGENPPVLHPTDLEGA